MRIAVLPIMLTALAVPGAAAAQEEGRDPLLVADTAQPGLIDLYLFGSAGTRAELYERVGETLRPVGRGVVESPAPAFRVLRAATWRCDRRTRRFTAVATLPDGTTRTAPYTVRTPPCAERLGWRAPRTALPGTRVAVTFFDRWRLGDIAPRLCVSEGRASTPACRDVAFGGAHSTTRTIRMPRAGRALLTLRLGATAPLTRTISTRPGAGGPAEALPVVLVTGDSTVQGIDTELAERLAGRARVVRGWEGGSALGVDRPRWTAFAARQADRLRPRVTVISLGANEGWPITAPDGTESPCCGPAWRAEYARRAVVVMRHYARGGRGRVLWLALPTPRDPRRQVITAAVNAAVRAAVERDGAGTLVALDALISPGGEYRRAIVHEGRRRVVRQPDGIHLSPAGAEIATDLVVGALGRLPAG